MSDYTTTGYDPDAVLGYDEDEFITASNSDLGDAVPKVLDDLEMTGDLQTDAVAELDAIAAGFRERKDKEAERFELAVNTDYWMCLCFATQAQRNAFVDAAGWRDLGTRYLDGREVARRLGYDLPPDPEWPNSKRDTTWDKYAMTVEENRSIPTE
jgi:hypothetical protein